ncbi:cupin domain-containing protein [Vibrio ostreicida]|uniref:Cupin domain-containing protein n=1 Tax=Vibrio ostreicida TaxID=526588 RepID=A0ABT8BZC9_9VIBR|nr:cupin domain-containing protein [Vibrio ostreicida]MDN3611774.1 cupin domain-containing protein [Vibrio ostreicida]NPD09589.1 cupin domain-containing protein [Vibrio ostreicida]
MKAEPINFLEKFSQISECWSPSLIAEMNDCQFKLVKIEGEFVWHVHPETDKVFVVLEGAMGVEFRDRVVTIEEGEMLVVPKGVEHKPLAHGESKIMLIEPKPER